MFFYALLVLAMATAWNAIWLFINWSQDDSLCSGAAASPLTLCKAGCRSTVLEGVLTIVGCVPAHLNACLSAAQKNNV